ncbi:hypothetical protein COP2_014247 [Malus domestica]
MLGLTASLAAATPPPQILVSFQTPVFSCYPPTRKYEPIPHRLSRVAQ